MESFWAKVRKTDGCWVWVGSKDRHGYGCFRLFGKQLGAHRTSWAIAHGGWPQLHVSHRCDNPACVNPDHLFLGHPHAKLTRKDVVDVRRMYHSGMSQDTLAARYKVSQAQISRVINKKRWSHI